MYRNTYAEVNLSNIENNVKTLIKNFNNYKYYIGVVKADCYGHNGIKTVKAILKGGCNYLAVATLEEALQIRKYIIDIPILVLGVISKKYISKCIEKDISITINSLDYLMEVLKFKNLKVHIKINTGMNRLGINNKDEFNKVYSLVNNNNLILEGIYTHIHTPNDEKPANNQFNKFEEITKDIDLHKIPIVHIGASETTIKHQKKPYENGCRLGIAMYGLTNDKTLNLSSTFSLYSEVIQINDVYNETVGYNGAYMAKEHEKIAVISIGYADGIIRKNTNRNVFINNKEYKIVGNICMDMLFVKVDENVKVHDKVTIIKDNKHINEIAKHLDTIPYEVICSISKRVPRKYV